VVISDCAGGKARSLITEINAIQDLHGLPFPYVGGAYKNKLAMTVARIKAANTGGTWSGNVYSINNSTVTILTDSDNNITGFRANGTLNANTTFYLAINLPLSGEYIISTTTALPNGCYMSVRGGATADINPNYTDRSFTANGNCSVTIYIPQSANLTNYVYQPMIRLSTETDASFAPYSNICPISGRDSVVLTRSDGDEISEDFIIQLGQTVYGGTVNLVTGAARITTAITTITSFNTKSSASANNIYLTDVISGIKQGDVSAVANLLSNAFTAVKYNDLYNSAIYGIAETGDNKIGVGLPNITTKADADTWATANPIQICYELATPTTIQLTPTMLELLKGYNRVSIDNGSIELRYIAKLT
jgi:hypothetical protein